MRPDRIQSGFTLVEVMIAIGIMGITVAAGIPALSGFLESNRVDDTARELSGRLRLARQSAVAEGISRIVTWDSDAREYLIVRDENGDGVAQDGEPQLGPFTLARGLTIGNKAGDGFVGSQVIFNTNGSASETGTLVLANEAGYSLELTVLAPTGQVRLN